MRGIQTEASSPNASRAVRRVRVKAFAFLFLALAAGTGAVFLVKRYLDEQARRQPAANAAVVPVVVAAQDLAIGTALTEPVLGVIRWPSDAVPAGTFGVPKALLGRTLRRSIDKRSVACPSRHWKFGRVPPATTARRSGSTAKSDRPRGAPGSRFASRYARSERRSSSRGASRSRSSP